MRAFAALVLCACGTTGTINLDLATAPDSHLLDGVQRLRLTVTDPHQIVEAARTSAGFDLALDLDATQTNGALIVEGFDAAGALVACGQSPRFPIAAINAHVVVYMAAPRSIAVAPAAMRVARSGVAGTALGFGAVVAGGSDAVPGSASSPSSAIAVYNAFDHTFIEGIALLAPRTGLAIAAGSGSNVYLFGGQGPDGQPTGTLWRFDTAVAPNGQFTPLVDQPEHARTGQLLVPIASEHFLITGTPALELNAGVLTARSEVAGLPAAGAGVLPGDGNPTAVFAGDAVVRFRSNAFDTLNGEPGGGAAAVTLPGGRIAVIGGTSSPDALVIDGVTGAVTTIRGALSTPRMHPAVAATSRHVVVVGGLGTAGEPLTTADVLDAQTLAPIVTLPFHTGTGGFAVALPNDQVLIGGGTPAVQALELFTPEPPP